MGAVVGRMPSTTSEENDAIDGELASRVFQLMALSDQRLQVIINISKISYFIYPLTHNTAKYICIVGMHDMNAYLI